MASGCYVIESDTGPVRAVARRAAERLYDRRESRTKWLAPLGEMGLAIPG